MRTHGSWLGGAVVATLLAAGTAARADAPSPKATPVYVLSVDSDDADDQADALTVALRAQVKHANGFSLAETPQSLGTLLVALKCPPKPDAPCLERIGEQIRADHFIWGQMSKKAGRITVDLHLWSRGKPDTRDSEAYADTLTNANDPALIAVAAHAVGQLIALPPPAAPPPPPVVAPPTHVAKAEEPKAAPPANNGAARAITGAVLLGVGVAGVVVGAVEGARFYSARNDLNEAREGVPATVTDVCNTTAASASSACDDYRRATAIRTTEFVAFGVGAAAIIAGAVLIALPSDHPKRDDSAPATSFHVAPLVFAHGGGGALLGGSF